MDNNRQAEGVVGGSHTAAKPVRIPIHAGLTYCECPVLVGGRGENATFRLAAAGPEGSDAGE